MGNRKIRRDGDRPTLEQVTAELERERYRRRFGRARISTVFTLLIVAAAAVLVATVWMPVLRICGTSMMPTLAEGEIVLSLKGAEIRQGDLVAFYLGNKILVKRSIAGPGQWIDLDEGGAVFVDGKALEEPYLTEKALGECDLTLPYQVPDGCHFCRGDHRAASVDSRHSSVGCVTEEQIVGKVVFRVWPLNKLGVP